MRVVAATPVEERAMQHLQWIDRFGGAWGRGAALAAMAAATLLACGDETATTPATEEPFGYTIDPPPLADRPVDSLLTGSFYGFGNYQGVAGYAQLQRTQDGRSAVQVIVEGLVPNVAYPVHLHALPCDINQGGGHYKIDPSIEDTVPENEIWPSFTTGDAGVGVADLWVDHRVRGDALSVVVHDPNADGAKMACADLWAPGDGWTATGTMAPFAYASELDGTIGGTGTFTVGPGGTSFEANLTGLRADQTYAFHLHAQPCSVQDGAGHYKIDPMVEGTVVANELWPELGPIAEDGSGTATLSSPHVARADAQSIVIHRMQGEENPKVACMDLVRTDYADVVTEGRTTLLPAATERGYGGMSGTATMTRSLNGYTRVLLGVQGLRQGLTYPVHVHAYTCAVEFAGGHYKLDRAVQDVIEANEIWLDFAADGNGNGTQQAQIDGVARPDAVSLIIHDPEDAARLACIDLR